MSSYTRSPKCVLYQQLIDNFCIQSYLKRSITYNGKKNVKYQNLELFHTLWPLKMADTILYEEVRGFVMCDQNHMENQFIFFER